MDTIYEVHSISQSRFNRAERAELGVGRRKQFILSGQHRLVNKRPVQITEKELLEHLSDLKEKVAHHMLEVRTLDGRLVDLATLQPAPAEVAPPLPSPLVDTVERDTQNVGQKMPLFPDGPALDTTPATPEPTPVEAAEESAEEPAPEPGPELGELSAEQEYIEPEPVTAVDKPGGRRRRR